MYRTESIELRRPSRQEHPNASQLPGAPFPRGFAYCSKRPGLARRSSLHRIRRRINSEISTRRSRIDPQNLAPLAGAGCDTVQLTHAGCDGVGAGKLDFQEDFAGVGLYVLDGKPVFVYNLCDVERYRVEGPDQLAPGKHVVTLDFNYAGGGLGKGGTATLSVDGNKVDSTEFPRTIGYRMSLDETLDIGEDTGTPVSEDYQAPFKFTGEIEKVTIQITDHELTEEQLQQYRQQQVKAALSR